MIKKEQNCKKYTPNSSTKSINKIRSSFNDL